MRTLTQEEIELINEKCPYGQGIFREPFGIPTHIKEQVVYTKWESAGRGGSCWDDEDTVNEDYSLDRPEDAFEVLKLLLKILKPNYTESDYFNIKYSFDSNTETDYGYYEDYTEDTIEWITLSDVYKKLEELN